jgi:hypothetical protein
MEICRNVIYLHTSQTKMLYWIQYYEKGANVNEFCLEEKKVLFCSIEPRSNVGLAC